ncbi:MAG TPA: hypothetical protein DCE52_04855 [Rhodobacteraceae bacterium]|nr:hypothetical protein [Paracoccaceae bacterium]
MGCPNHDSTKIIPPEGRALEAIYPPAAVELRDGFRPYWDTLVKTKAGRPWNDQDLLMLVELSRNLFRTERLSFQILSEDEIIKTGQGLKANPKSGLLDQLVKRARLIMVYLQVHSEATQGRLCRKHDAPSLCA